MFELYLDYPDAMTSIKKIYNIKPHIGKSIISNKDNIQGIEACLWSEHIEEENNLEEHLFPRLLALSEISWCKDLASYEEFLDRAKDYATKQENMVKFRPYEKWELKGKARRIEAINYFERMNSKMNDETRKQTVEASSPSKEFAQNFIKKFFKPWDIPFLLKNLMK